MRRLAPLALLLLAACQREQAAPPPAEAPAPASAPATTDFSGAIMAIGTEPFWSLAINGTELHMTRPDHPTVKLTAPGAQIQPGQGVWKATDEHGAPLVATLRVAECSDGMSDRKYPMSAEVEYAGQTLHGCAAKASDLEKAIEDALGGDLSVDLPK